MSVLPLQVPYAGAPLIRKSRALLVPVEPSTAIGTPFAVTWTVMEVVEFSETNPLFMPVPCPGLTTVITVGIGVGVGDIVGVIVGVGDIVGVIVGVGDIVGVIVDVGDMVGVGVDDGADIVGRMQPATESEAIITRATVTHIANDDGFTFPP